MSKFAFVGTSSEVAQLSPQEREDLRLLRVLFNKGLSYPFCDDGPNEEEFQAS